MKKNKIIAMIPARIGSERLKYKNLALLNNKPLIYYAINSSKKSKIFDKIVINSDNIIFKEIAKKNKIHFYLRPKKYGSANTKSDDVVYDFLKKNSGYDFLVWVNPVAPLIEAQDIINTVSFFKKKKLDSLITSEFKKTHAFFKKKPINFKIKEKFRKTQDLVPVNLFTYGLMMWRVKNFIKNFKLRKSAMISGKFLNYDISSEKSLKINNAEDLKIAEIILKTKSKKNQKKIKYSALLKKLKKN